MKTKTTKSETLAGQALNWAVLQALGLAPTIDSAGKVCYRSDHGSLVSPDFESAADAGEIIHREWIGLDRPSKGQTPPLWRAITDTKTEPRPGQFRGVSVAWGVTPFLAAMRALVLSRVGEKIQIPEQLFGG